MSRPVFNFSHLHIFLPVNVCLRWLVCLFLYNCGLVKLDWLAACIALRVVGAVLVVFLH
jgi:hypothetical protein